MFFRKGESAMKKSAWAGGINHKFGGDLNRLASGYSSEKDSVLFLGNIGKFDLIEIGHSELFRLANEIVIEIGTIPMGVGDLFVRAGAHHELAAEMRVGSVTS